MVYVSYKQPVWSLRICTRIHNLRHYHASYTCPCTDPKYPNYSLLVDRNIFIYLRIKNSKLNKITNKYVTYIDTDEQIFWALDIGSSCSISDYHSIWNHYCWTSARRRWFRIFTTIICSFHSGRSSVILGKEIMQVLFDLMVNIFIAPLQSMSLSSVATNKTSDPVFDNVLVWIKSTKSSWSFTRSHFLKPALPYWKAYPFVCSMVCFRVLITSVILLAAVLQGYLYDV